MPEWTEEQKNAIESRDGTILVSAAAGSGKTAVLVERVVQRLIDEEKPCPVDSLLIVTFTRAATKQMKERIYKALSKKLWEFPDSMHLKHQLMLLPFAHISTIDSFCGDLVRENFHELNISPDCKMVEGAELKIIEADAISKTLNELYKNRPEGFTELADLLVNGADDTALSDLIKKLYNNSMAFSRPYVWLESLSDEYKTLAQLKESRWGKLIIEMSLGAVSYCRIVLGKMRSAVCEDKIAEEKYSGNIDEIEQVLTLLEKAIEEKAWDDIREAFLNVKFSNLGRLPKGYSSMQTDYIKEQKKCISEILKKTAVYFCATEKENETDVEELKPVVMMLIKSVRRYGEIFSEMKASANAVDFSDITHLALKLLVNFDKDGVPVKTPLAVDISEKYAEILVDEYQDINEIQNVLFSAVSKDNSNLFMVGDVKQSIYRFRQAMPEIFLSRRDTLKPYTDCNYPARINLDRNFRSRSGVTQNINFIFSQLMSKETGAVDYGASESLVAAASYNDCDFPQFELEIVGDMNDGSRVNRELEAECVATKIEEIFKQKMQVKDDDNYRDVSYRDFCILLRSASGGKAEIYAKALSKRNIPAYVSDKSGFFEATEVSIILNLMRLIDNPLQDIPLLSVMLSPIFGFTPDELAQMRIEQRQMPLYHCVVSFAKNGDKKSTEFLTRLEKLRMLSSTLPCTEFLREMYDETGYSAIVSAMKNGSKRHANLTKMLDYAAKYEGTGHRGLSGFIRFIDRVQQQNADLESASDVSEAADVVRIMTIHKSKGLEFPVCIIADMNSPFMIDGQRGSIAFHPHFGIGFDIKNNQTKCRYSTLGKKAVAIAEANSSLSEELRILYVAMTRAKERLICFTRCDNIGKKLDFLSSAIGIGGNVNTYIIRTCSCMAEWIWLACLRHPDASALRNRLSFDVPECIRNDETIKVTLTSEFSEVNQTDEKEEKSEADAKLLSEITERLAYSYPFSDLAYVRAKSAPSEFDSQIFSTENFASAKPQFLSKSGLNSADRGTATHKFMEFFDYTAPSYDINAQAKRMVEEHRMTQQEADALDKPKIDRFFKSDIAKRIKKSPLLLREEKVTIGVPASELYPELDEVSGKETVVIQGYVDCAFEENGKFVIVDYKTDRNVTMEELKIRYNTQLKMYERALRECTGSDISCTLIYSFENGEYICL